MSASPNALAIVSSDIWAAKDVFESVLVDRSLNFEREAGFAIQILQASDYALGLAERARQSVVDAVTNIAAIGLSLNPARKHAYLVPRDKKICLDVSYMGLIELAISSGSIAFAQARVVHASDTYQDNGVGAAPTHKFNAFSKERGEIVGVYVVAKLASGDFLCETMTVEDINRIRDRSESFKSGKNSPWKSDWAEMAKKTVVKRASKYWPKTERLDRAVHYLNTDGGEGITGTVHGVEVPQVLGFEPAAWIKRALATADEKSLLAVYAEAMAAASSAGDREGAVAFKNAALAHRAALRQKLSDNTIDMERKAA